MVLSGPVAFGMQHAHIILWGLQTNSGTEIVLHKEMTEMWWEKKNGALIQSTTKPKHPLFLVSLRASESPSEDGFSGKQHIVHFLCLRTWSPSIWQVEFMASLCLSLLRCFLFFNYYY